MIDEQFKLLNEKTASFIPLLNWLDLTNSTNFVEELSDVNLKNVAIVTAASENHFEEFKK